MVEQPCVVQSKTTTTKSLNCVINEKNDLIFIYFFYDIFCFVFKDPSTNYKILSNELRIQGIIVNTFKKDWPKAFTEMNQYIKEVSFDLRIFVFKIESNL